MWSESDVGLVLSFKIHTKPRGAPGAGRRTFVRPKPEHKELFTFWSSLDDVAVAKQRTK